MFHLNESFLALYKAGDETCTQQLTHSNSLAVIIQLKAKEQKLFITLNIIILSEHSIPYHPEEWHY